ncbi:MAG: hydroxyisourate hydrolase [Acidobacteriota bacterium]|nr:hydroxyisourate hydrolase [Acidobacteriota bacterium]
MSAITTHVLDTSRGRPAAGVSVLLERRAGHGEWHAVGRGDTDLDGRVRELIAEGEPLIPGVYRLKFDTGRYFEAQNVHAFYPEVVVVFEATPDETHYHVPLLLGPFGYTTYRGT